MRYVIQDIIYFILHYRPSKSTSPLPSVSKISITLCISGFSASSGMDLTSAILKDPEWSWSNLRNLFPRRFISSVSTGKHVNINNSKTCEYQQF